MLPAYYSLDQGESILSTHNAETDATNISQAPTPPDMPYIYRPPLRGTVCQLLNIESQFEDLKVNQFGPNLAHAMTTVYYFLPSIEIYNYMSAADSKSHEYWTQRARTNGLELLDFQYPSLYFFNRMGMTQFDHRYLVEVMDKGHPVDRVYS